MRQKGLKGRLLAVLLAAAMFSAAGALSGTALAAEEGNALEIATPGDAANGVVQVYATGTLSTGKGFGGFGSAFGIGTVGEETDIFVTNRHVVTETNDDGSYTVADHVYIMTEVGSYSITRRAINVNGKLVELDALKPIPTLKTEQMTACNVIYYDEDVDFAILQAVEPVKGRVALGMADSAEYLKAGETVYALGYPEMSDVTSTLTDWVDSGNTYDGYPYHGYPIWTYTYELNSRIEDVTITTGAISRYTTMAAENNTKVIQHDATTDYGHSGGPLVTSGGLVVGINTYGGNASESLNYAIYIDYVKDCLDDLGIEIPVAAVADDVAADTETDVTVEPDPFTVTVSNSANGTVTSSAAFAEKGNTVTLTAAPEDGYALESLTVTAADGTNVTLTQADDTKYTFAMPDGNVTVQASFVQIKNNTGAIGVIVAIVVVAIIAVAVITVQRKKKRNAKVASKPQVEPVPQPIPVPEPWLIPDIGSGAAIPVVGAQQSSLIVFGSAGEMAGREYPIGNGPLLFGRDSTANIRFSAKAKGISRIHCRLFYSEQGELMLMDCGSSYGTLLKGYGKLTSQKPVLVKAGDTFCLGSEKTAFTIRTASGN